MLGSVVTVVVVDRAGDGNPLDDGICLKTNDVSHADFSFVLIRQLFLPSCYFTGPLKVPCCAHPIKSAEFVCPSALCAYVPPCTGWQPLAFTVSCVVFCKPKQTAASYILLMHDAKAASKDRTVHFQQLSLLHLSTGCGCSQCF